MHVVLRHAKVFLMDREERLKCKGFVGNRHQGYFYYTRTEEGKQYRIHCRRPVPESMGPPTGAVPSPYTGPIRSDEPYSDQPYCIPVLFFGDVSFAV